MYEPVQSPNGTLPQWGTRAVLVDKVENPKPGAEPRLTFDYSKVTEDLPGTFMFVELSSKVHGDLSNPRHRFSADLNAVFHTGEIDVQIVWVFAFPTQ